MARRKAVPVRAYAGERMVDLPPIAPSGVEGDGPHLGELTEASWPHGDLRRRVRSRPWSPSVEPEPEIVDWTAELVRRRMAEAMGVLDRLPLTSTDRPSRTLACWPLPVVHSIASAYNYGQVGARAVPTAEEIGRMDEALAWLGWIPADWRAAVAGVARTVPLRRIARIMKTHPEQVRRLERKGVERIARRLRQKIDPTKIS